MSKYTTDTGTGRDLSTAREGRARSRTGSPTASPCSAGASSCWGWACWSASSSSSSSSSWTGAGGRPELSLVQSSPDTVFWLVDRTLLCWRQGWCHNNKPQSKKNWHFVPSLSCPRTLLALILYLWHQRAGRRSNLWISVLWPKLMWFVLTRSSLSGHFLSFKCNLCLMKIYIFVSITKKCLFLLSVTNKCWKEWLPWE